jgi:hypothetical protein
MLCVPVDERADFKELHKSLTKCYERCLQDSEYVEATLPTFNGPEISGPRLANPEIVVTKPPVIAQLEAHSMVSPDRAPEISAGATRSNASTNDAPIMEDGEVIGPDLEVPNRHDGGTLWPENTEARQRQRKSKPKRIFDYMGSCLQIPLLRRRPDSS